jgi:hypothetical protein
MRPSTAMAGRQATAPGDADAQAMHGARGKNMGGKTRDQAGAATHTFSKVLSIVPLYSKCTRALTYEDLCQAASPSRVRYGYE